MECLEFGCEEGVRGSHPRVHGMASEWEGNGRGTIITNHQYSIQSTTDTNYLKNSVIKHYKTNTVAKKH